MADRIELIHELESAAVPDRRAITCADGSTVTFAVFDRQVRSVANCTAERIGVC
jgi:hypothetical protein